MTSAQIIARCGYMKGGGVKAEKAQKSIYLRSPMKQHDKEVRKKKGIREDQRPDHHSFDTDP